MEIIGTVAATEGGTVDEAVGGTEGGTVAEAVGGTVAEAVGGTVGGTNKAPRDRYYVAVDDKVASRGSTATG